MPDKKDYYEILSVPRDASEKDIKTSYRKLAMKYHPDRSDATDAEDRFKEISEAYAVLSDPDKRKQYDQFGHAGINSQYSQEDLFRGVNFEDIFRGFGGDSIFDMFFGGGRRRGPSRGNDLRYDLELTLEQAASGLESTVEVPRAESCPTCGGSGARPGTSPAKCANCGGTGQFTRAQNTPFGQMISSTTCPKCRGRGQIITAPCEDCSGSGRIHRRRKINIKIPQGVDSGQHIKLRGQGEAASEPGGQAGDLYVFINIRPHPRFARSESDLMLEIPISITQAALGSDVDVPTLSGKARIKVPPGTQTASVFRLKGKGMPRLHGSGTGDLHVKMNVRTPSSLTARQRQLLNELSAEFGEKRIEEANAPEKGEKRKPEKGEKSFIDKIVDEVKGAVQ
jgi:molecular chaperone DnaJ